MSGSIGIRDDTEPLVPIVGDSGDTTVSAGATVDVVPSSGRLAILLVNLSDAPLPIRLGLDVPAQAGKGLPLWARGELGEYLRCAISIHNPNTEDVDVTWQGLGTAGTTP